jgi:hypothetical protein
MESLIRQELIPYKIPFEKIRLGRNYDGGYIIFNSNLDKLNGIYSYGINDDVSFDLDFTKYSSSNIYMYDHTIDSLPQNHSSFILTKEAGSIENIIKHIQTTNPNSNKLFLKMDIEGCEWELLDKLNEKYLNQFEQLVIEFHNIAFLQNEYFGNFNITYELILRVFKKLNQYFYLGHIHGNNCGGIAELPNTVECTYIRKDLVPYIPEIENDTYPIKDLDYPNDSSIEDYILNWWIR